MMIDDKSGAVADLQRIRVTENKLGAETTMGDFYMAPTLNEGKERRREDEILYEDRLSLLS
ncbi:hypothetical protein E2C01_061242 [Portunus trituberculatus]|uniref:Uncharacterized protein n=1 Tax=Portunus trituberculatus TaxID=210409 RepID=A0A5B7HCM5_PORTR|nr:hypothetical protein [Portunus trituberculatus]